MNLINKKYKILNKLGEGNFGSIYKGQNIRTNELVAIKVEPIKNDIKLLKNEAIIYQYLNNMNIAPIVKWFGKDSLNHYMVISLLGDSLQSIKNKVGTFSLIDILKMAKQLVSIIKFIHSKGLVHRDIKPANFLFGINNEKNTIFIIDFGLCKPYLINDSHICEKSTNNLIGSHSYASLNSHNCIELSRRDDLESLGYMLLYFYLGKLPWQDIVKEKIVQMKRNITNDNNTPEILRKFIKYARNLAFEENPDYSFILDIFNIV